MRQESTIHLIRLRAGPSSAWSGTKAIYAATEGKRFQVSAALR